MGHLIQNEAAVFVLNKRIELTMEHRELEDGGLQGQQYQKGSATAGSCTAYLQLFAGWLVLNLLTFMMATVPHSAQFLDIEPGFNWASGHAESDRYSIFLTYFIPLSGHP